MASVGNRRKSREAALQFLFQEDFSKNALHSEHLAERLQQFCLLYEINLKAQEYSLLLLTDYYRHMEEVDALIGQAATHWRLSRIAAMDRNLLRLAVSEMMADNDVPDQVAINEAVEIAKRFGSSESPAFVNGVLDAVRATLRAA